MIFTAIVARAYPEAKRQLIAQGRSAAQVEAMPSIQVVALHSYKLYEQARDEIFKWAGLPYWQAAKGMTDSELHPAIGWDKLKGGIPFAIVLPAINAGFYRTGPGRPALNVAQYIEADSALRGRSQGDRCRQPGRRSPRRRCRSTPRRKAFRLQGRTARPRT